MVISQDNTQNFIPNKKPRLVILGTMVAICARTLDGREPDEETFYYHNNRNHFWRVMQHLLAPEKDVIKNMTIDQKKRFLNKHGVAIHNLVSEIIVPNVEAHDPSDTILFKAHRNKRLKFKEVSPEVKKVLETTPKFFTCRYKKGIQDLVTGFLSFNNMDVQYRDKIWYLPTPTRCNPQARSEIWREEMNAFNKRLKL